MDKFTKEVLKVFRIMFVTKPVNWRDNKSGWAVPFVNASASELEKFLVQAISS